MVKFGKFIKDKKPTDTSDFVKLFASLDRQASHTDLRPAQRSVLKLLGPRRSEHDLVLKISTGAGKTAVGLLYLYSFLEERKEPVVYLCPTVQLIEQVLGEAHSLGIPAHHYPAGEPRPHADGLAGKAVLVCSYEKLFNARTTFNRQDVLLRPSALVLDDAHAGVERVRAAFTARVSTGDTYNAVVKLLSGPLSKYQPGLWSDLMRADPSVDIEVPFWIWRGVVDEVREILSDVADDELPFVWAFIRDELQWCRCVISAHALEIVPDIPPVENIRAYAGAKNRLFMSATLADDSVLVRELACDKTAAENPVRAKNDQGLGERMVIAPHLFDHQIKQAWIVGLVSALAKTANVVILSPSGQSARKWESAGASVVMGDDVSEAVRRLKKTKPNLVAFVQRYDGIDLPDDACRVIVLDGLPVGEGVVDRYDSQRMGILGGMRSTLIHRIEQGLGRAVRSAADYAVVILAGEDLTSFISRKGVLDAMNPDTRAQLELARELAELARSEGVGAKDAIVDMIKQCIKRDDEWKRFYNEKIRAVERKTENAKVKRTIRLAAAEREAFSDARANNVMEAISVLSSAIQEMGLDGAEKGWYLQKIAVLQYGMDKAESLRTQHAAHALDRTLFRPPELVKRPTKAGQLDGAAIFLRWYQNFTDGNGAIAAFHDIRLRAMYSNSAGTVEQAFAELAAILGAEGSRPEKEFGEGPDILWIWAGQPVVIEAKTGNLERLHKSDAQQILHHVAWFRRVFAPMGQPVALMLSRADRADAKSGFPEDIRVMTNDGLGRLVADVESFLIEIAGLAPGQITAKKVRESQQKHGLLPAQILSGYTTKIREQNR